MLAESLPDFSGWPRKQLVEYLLTGPDARSTFNEWEIRFTISTQVRALREREGWTQKQLAQIAGLSIWTISRLENLLHVQWLPQIGTLITIAQAFDVALIIRFGSWSNLLECWYAITPVGLFKWTQESVTRVDDVPEQWALDEWLKQDPEPGGLIP